MGLFLPKVKCSGCGRLVKMGKLDNSGKFHGHCFKCRREYHFTLSGRTYWHPYLSKTDQFVINFNAAMRQYRDYKNKRV